jgi:hypothetical protein
MEHHEEPAVAAQQPEYNDDVKKEPSTPSAHSKDGSKEKEGGFYNDQEMPVYTDMEGQEGEIHLETAEDIVTHVIDVDDDPTLNPWTFRMFFIGTAAISNESNAALFLPSDFAQEWAFRASEPFSRRFTISSPKSFMCRSVSLASHPANLPPRLMRIL